MVKRFNPDPTLTPEQIKAEVHKQRTGQVKPTTKAGRPKGIHTTPKPSARPRNNITARTEEQFQELFERFLKNLETSCRVVHSCDLAGLDYSELLRRRRSDAKVDERFMASYEIGLQALEDEATRRAFVGVEQPVFYKGEVCGSVLNYSDSLMQFLLKGGKPEKFKERTQNENTNFNVDLAERLEAARKRGGGDK